jgi:hypothetical protein
MQFQIGDIVISNNPWLIGLIGARCVPGVITHAGMYSSKIRLVTDDNDITLMNDYIDKITMDNDKEKDELKIGDLVELKPRIKSIISLQGYGTIIDKTVIKTSDFDGRDTKNAIDSFLVYFPEEDYTYTIPCSCLQLFSG